MRSLEAFRAVMRHGGFVNAAENLSLTPSAVSHRIRELETHLGVRLFERRNRTVVPTEDAARYHVTVSEVFERLEAATRSVTERREAEVLSLHCTPTFAAQWLMPRLKHFIAAHPDLDVRLASTPDAAALQDGVFDLDIQYARPTPPGCESFPLATEAVTPLASPETANAIRHVDDLRHAKLLHSVRNVVGWARWFDDHAAAVTLPARSMQFDRSFLAIAAAADGLGVCLESTLMAEREIGQGRLVMLFPDKVVRAVGHRLVWRARMGDQRKIVAFREWLSAALVSSAPRA